MTPTALYTPDFEIFWRAYPNRKAKLAAAKAWKTHKPVLQEVLDALKWQTRQAQWLKDDGAFVPHPATWLNAHRWLDENPQANKVDLSRIVRREPEPDEKMPF